MTLEERSLDLITMGRAIIDVYGEQVGCDLEEVSTFAKYVGGCPANIAIGTTRLGVRVGMITRVGDEHHGRFLRAQLQREGVDTTFVRTDPDRLTGVAFLAVRDKTTFPLLHYRDDCADMAIEPSDYPDNYLASARALLVSGSHLTTDKARSNLESAVARARACGTKVVFDIDYRPLFWRLVQRDRGESRFEPSVEATRATQRILPTCDLIVGTEEEIHLAGGDTDTIAALRAIRATSAAPIVLKRGALGCVVFPGPIPASVNDGIVGEGFPVQVFNLVGAGDGFFAGFLSGWLRHADWSECARLGNACGALVVSRHGCSPASPTRVELDWFLAHYTRDMAPHHNAELEHIHRATTCRMRPIPALILSAIAHRSSHSTARAQFQTAFASAVLKLGGSFPNLGVIIDGVRDEEILYRLGGTLAWLGRTIETDEDAVLMFEDGCPASILLRSWPRYQILVCRAPSDPTDSVIQERLRELRHAVEHHQVELVLQLPEAIRDVGEGLAHIEDVQACGLRPDWWQVPRFEDSSAWSRLEATISAGNPMCRGLLVDVVANHSRTPLSFDAAGASFVKGVVDATLVDQLANEWLAGSIDEDGVYRKMAEALQYLASAFASHTPA